MSGEEEGTTCQAGRGQKKHSAQWTEHHGLTWDAGRKDGAHWMWNESELVSVLTFGLLACSCPSLKNEKTCSYATNACTRKLITPQYSSYTHTDSMDSALRTMIVEFTLLQTSGMSDEGCEANHSLSKGESALIRRLLFFLVQLTVQLTNSRKRRKPRLTETVVLSMPITHSHITPRSSPSDIVTSLLDAHA